MSVQKNLLRTPLLIEAVKGGFSVGENELHGHLQWVDRTTGKIENRRLTHDKEGRKVSSLGKGIAKHQHLISEPGMEPALTISVIKRGKRNYDFYDSGELKSRIAITSITVDHKSLRKTERNKQGLTIMRTGMINTHEDHRRKGWGSTIFDHAKRLLHKHIDVDLQHDWEHQLDPGKRWAARQEVSRGGSPHLRHRKSQEWPGMKSEITKMLSSHHPELEKHHGKLSSLANIVLDQGGGFFGNRETRSFRSAAKRMGIHHSKLGDKTIHSILRLHGGDSE